MQDIKQSLIEELQNRVQDKILEPANAELLIKLINNADSSDEAINIAALGTTYKRTGLHFDKRLEKMTDCINYFKKNDKLSFHNDDTKPVNKLIIGDNYQALQNLLIQYKGQIDVIYIDPPYGKDSMGEFAKTNYNNAITRDNLLSMLYPRLILAKQLLSDEGVIFCSIDDKNQAYVKCLFDEVFGENNFIDCLHWKKKKQPSFLKTHTAKVMEYILIYATNSKQVKKLSLEKISDETKKVVNLTNKVSDRHFSKGVRVKCGTSGIITKGSYKIKTMIVEYLNDVYFENGITTNDVNVRAQFSVSQEKIDEYIKENLLFITVNKGLRRDVSDAERENKKSICDLLLDWGDNQDSEKEVADIFGKKVFDYAKPIKLIQNLINSYDSDSKDELTILDFFAGSGTTGNSVLEISKNSDKNISYILCQLDEDLDELLQNVSKEEQKTIRNQIDFCNSIQRPHKLTEITVERLRRLMLGESIIGTKDFPWLEDNEPYGGNLDVYEIESVASFETTRGKSPFDVIDETLYGTEKFKTVKEKIDWVCSNFEKTQKELD